MFILSIILIFQLIATSFATQVEALTSIDLNLNRADEASKYWGTVVSLDAANNRNQSTLVCSTVTKKDNYK
jgi:hypothetical protein